MNRAQKTDVVMVGTYSAMNKGDATMQQVFSGLLRSNYGEVRPILSSPFPNLDAARYPDMLIVRSRRRNIPLATLQLLALVAAKPFGLERFIAGSTTELRSIRDALAVVDLSGDMLTEDYGMLICWSHFLPLMHAMLLGTPVMICAQSVGPFNWMNWLARRIFQRATIVTVRESISYATVRDLGVRDADVKLTADLAFLLPAAPESRLHAIQGKIGMIKDDTPILGVSVSALLADSGKARFRPALPMKKLAEIIDQAATRHRMRVLLVSHVYGPRPSGDDRRIAKHLAGLMTTPTMITEDEYEACELKALISKCSVFIGCRMHANLAALDSGVPTLALGYSHKSVGILDDMGLSEWSVDYRTLDASTLTEKVEALIAEADSYRAKLQAALPECRVRARQNLHLFAERCLSLPQ